MTARPMDIEQLISSYLDGDLTGDQEAELHHTLALSPEARALFREHISLQRVARDERVLHRPDEMMRAALFARLHEDEGMERGAAVAAGAVIATPVAATLLSDGVPDATTAPEPLPDLPRVTRTAPTTPVETRPPIARAADRRDDERRRRRLIPILIPLMLVMIVGGTFWFGGGLDMIDGDRNVRDFGTTTEGEHTNDAIADAGKPTASSDAKADSIGTADVREEVVNETTADADATNRSEEIASARPAETVRRSEPRAHRSTRGGGRAHIGADHRADRTRIESSASASSMSSSIVVNDGEGDQTTENDPPRTRSGQTNPSLPSALSEAARDVAVETPASRQSSQGFGRRNPERDIAMGDDDQSEDADALADSESPERSDDDLVAYDFGETPNESDGGEMLWGQNANVEAAASIIDPSEDLAAFDSDASEEGIVATMTTDSPGAVGILSIQDHDGRAIRINRDNSAAIDTIHQWLAARGMIQDTINGGYTFSDQLLNADASMSLDRFLAQDDGSLEYLISLGDEIPSVESIALNPQARSMLAEGQTPLEIIGTRRGGSRDITLKAGQSSATQSGGEASVDGSQTPVASLKGDGMSIDDPSLEKKKEPLGMTVAEGAPLNPDGGGAHRFFVGLDGAAAVSINPVAETALLSGVDAEAIERMAALSDVKVAGGPVFGPKERHRVYVVGGLSAYNEREQIRRREVTRTVDAGGNVSFATSVTMRDRVRAAMEPWGGVGYRITIPIVAKLSGGADLSAGIGTKYLRLELVIPFTYSVTDNIRVEVTPRVRYRTAHGTAEPTVTGAIDPSAPSSFSEEGLIVPADRSDVTLGAGFGLILLMR